MMNDPVRQRCELDDVFVLLTDRKIENDQEIIPWMEALNAKGFKKMLIVAEDVSGAALQALVLNGVKGRFLGAAVPVPVGGEMKIPSLEDLAALTGAEVIAESKGTTLEEVDLSKLGRARRILATKDFSVIIDGKGSKKKVKQRIAIIRKELKEADEGWETTRLKERLGRLTGGVAILRFGAVSETESKEMKYRIEDSVHATRHALEGGIVPGGETALLMATKVLDKLKVSGDEVLGVSIVKQALSQPIKVLATNAGASGNEVMKRVLEANGTWKRDFYGYDAAKDKYCMMIKSGIIDPVKVVKSAIVNSSKQTSLILVTDAIITDVERNDIPKDAGDKS